MTIVVDASVALRWCFQLNGSDRAEELLRSDDRLIAPDLVIAEISNAAWKFVIFDRMTAKSARSAVREVVKAFEELMPTSVLRFAPWPLTAGSGSSGMLSIGARV